jgi:hypothetical protein
MDRRCTSAPYGYRRDPVLTSASEGAALGGFVITPASGTPSAGEGRASE